MNMDYDRLITQAKKDAEGSSELIQVLDVSIASDDEHIAFWQTSYRESEDLAKKLRGELSVCEQKIKDLKNCMKNSDEKYSIGEIEGFKIAMGRLKQTVAEKKRSIPKNEALARSGRKMVKKFEKIKEDHLKQKEKALETQARYKEYLDSADIEN